MKNILAIIMSLMLAFLTCGCISEKASVKNERLVQSQTIVETKVPVPPTTDGKEMLFVDETDEGEEAVPQDSPIARQETDSGIVPDFTEMVEPESDELFAPRPSAPEESLLPTNPEGTTPQEEEKDTFQEPEDPETTEAVPVETEATVPESVEPKVTEPEQTEEVPTEPVCSSEVIDTSALEAYGRSYASSSYGYNGTSACTPGNGAGNFPAATKKISSMEEGYSIVRQAIDSQYKRDVAYGYLPYEEIDGKIVRCPINIAVKSAGGPNTFTITVYYGGKT